MQERTRSISERTAELSVYEKGNARQINYSSKNANFTIEINDISEIASANSPVKKLFVFLLKNIGAECVSNGSLVRDTLNFNIKDLVEIGFYSAEKSARRGFDAGASILQGIRLKGYVTSGKKHKENGELVDEKLTIARGSDDIRDNIEAFSVSPFSSIYRRGNGNCFIRLNPDVNWNSIYQSMYTIVPNYYFSLGNRPSDLLIYIFRQARMNVKELSSAGHFNISYRSIQKALNLPDESSVGRDAKKLLKDPIRECVSAILREEEKNGSPKLSIELVEDPNSDISTYLDTGYLRVSIFEDYLDGFKKVAENKQKQISKQKQMEEKATAKGIEKAVEKNVSKKIESLSYDDTADLFSTLFN